MLDGFLTYPHDAPRLFYAAARRNRSGSLVRLLNLPPEDRVVIALEAAIPEWTEQESRRSLSEAVRQAKFLAERYFAENEVIRSTYNRAKHGATMLHHASLTPRQLYVLAPDLSRAKRAQAARYQLNKFTVNGQMIRSIERGIEIAGSMVRYLAGLARALSEADLLYPRRPQRT